MSKSVGRAEAERRIDEIYRIVTKMVQREIKKSPHHEMEDLIHDGMIGVFLNIDKWDPERSNLSNFVWMTARSWVFSHVLARDQCDCHKVNTCKLSLDAPVTKSDVSFGRDLLLGDIIPSDYNIESDVIERVELYRVLEALDKLGDKRIREIILKHFVINGGKNQREIAKDLGITHQRVQQLEKQGLERLRRMLK